MKYLSSIGMCYQVIESTLTWSDARDECNSLAGYDDMADLASISTYQEQVFITCKNYILNKFSLGLFFFKKYLFMFGDLDYYVWYLVKMIA